MAWLQMGSRGLWGAGVGVVVVAVAGAWSLSGRSAGSPKPSTLPREWSAEALASGNVDRQRLREAIRGEELTEEQRRELFQNFRQVRETQMRAHVEEYFNAPPDQKQAVLDKHIDEMQERMKEWERFRREREARGDAAPPGGAGERQRGGPPGRRGMRSQSRDERKARSESVSPDDTARRMAYHQAMRKRMAERGIEMPRGPGGRRGPEGGQRGDRR